MTPSNCIGSAVVSAAFSISASSPFAPDTIVLTLPRPVLPLFFTSGKSLNVNEPFQVQLP